MFQDLEMWLIEQYQVSAATADFLMLSIKLVMVIALCIMADLFTKKVLLIFFHRIIEKTKNKWDDLFIQQNVLGALSHLAPVYIISFFSQTVFSNDDYLSGVINRIATAVTIFIFLIVFNSIMNVALMIYRSVKADKKTPVKGYVQAIKLVVFFLGGVVIVATLLDRSPWGILSLLGGLTAILLLVFKDTILGFVASIMLSTNDMVQVGDWIEMPSYKADGDVIDISINTVKVQNWDKTISTIPTYSLITDSFKNWRGMSDSGGRRIKRSVNIDMQSIRFCDEAMLQRFEKIDLLKNYLADKKADIAKYAQSHPTDQSILVNGRRLTNIGTLRAYIIAYLKEHPFIHQTMTFLVRQLQPTAEGLPLEIYVFSKDQVWANYEGIQADIFDHILAVIPEFGLRVYQHPSGADFQKILH